MKIPTLEQVKKVLLIIFYVVVFFSVIVLLYDRLFRKTEYQQILEKDVKNLKKEQTILKENQERNYQKLDSIDKRIKEKQSSHDKIIEKYYFTKEVINQKLEKDENNISNTNLTTDSIQRYLSNYRYKPFHSPR